MIKKILTWGGVAFLIFFVAFQPTQAANVAKILFGTALDILQGVGDFFSSLVS